MGEAVAMSGRLAHFDQDGIGLVKEAKSKVGEPDLNNSSVVMDLVLGLLFMDGLGELTSQQEVLCLSNSVMNRMMIALKED